MINILTDSELVACYIQGDTRALSRLIERHKKKIYTSIFLLVRDEHQANDLFQDTFVKVIDRINDGRYTEEGKFLPWVMRIAHNQCIDHFRREKRRKENTENTVYDIFETLKLPDVPAADDGIVRGQSESILTAMLDRLPEGQREVVILRHYAGLSFKEIAVLTNCSINTALGRMRYGLINLRKMIDEKKLDL